MACAVAAHAANLSAAAARLICHVALLGTAAILLG
jgi:hypothetical protein